MATYECSVAGCQFTTTSALGIPSHARKHKNEFENITGRRPENYDEVRALFRGDLDDVDYDPGVQTTLQEDG